MRVFAIADTHFSHKNIIDYCKRPFENIEQMNKFMIDTWNKRVGKNDIVLHLGDFGFGTKEQLQEICSQLNGRKVLVKGNHDQRKGNQYWLDVGFDLVYKNKKLDLKTIYDDLKEKYEDFDKNVDELLEITGLDNVVVSHCPVVVGDNELNIHGHIHNAPLDTTQFSERNHICISAELLEYEPMVFW